MRLAPQDSFARLAIALGHADRAAVLASLGSFREKGRVTLGEFVAELLAARALDLDQADELRRIWMAVRVGCAGCARGFRVPRLDLDLAIACPSCGERLQLARDQRVGQLEPGKRIPEAVLVVDDAGRGRLEEQVTFESLEEMDQAAQREIASIEYALRRPVSRPASPNASLLVLPSWTWRHPRESILLGGLGALLVLAPAYYLASLELGESNAGHAIAIAGAILFVGGVVLFAWREPRGDRSRDVVLLSRDLGIVRIRGRTARRFPVADVVGVEVEREGVRIRGRESREITLPAREGYPSSRKLAGRIEGWLAAGGRGS